MTVLEDLELEAAVKYRIPRMRRLLIVPRIKQLEDIKDTVQELHVCLVADAIGMSSSPRGCRKAYSNFANVNTKVPTVANVDAICKVNTPDGNKGPYKWCTT